MQEVVSDQRAWAQRHGLALATDDRLARTEDALLLGGLHDDTRAELGAGAGGELERLASLRSSSCLAVNVFDPFRLKPRRVLQALGAAGEGTLRFEQRKPTGLRGTDPHLDVFFEPSRPMGVESKFVETYDPRGVKNEFRPSYFAPPGLWDRIPAAETVARRIAQGDDQYHWLAAGQLLKHALGLSKHHPDGFALVLVWYRVDDPISALVDEEVGRFSRAVGDAFPFWAVTYQQLIRTIRANRAEPTPGYLAYLEGRYGQATDASPQRSPLSDLAVASGVTARRRLADSIRSVVVDDVVTGYHVTIARSPDRHARGKRYLVAHDGTGPTDKPGSEQAVAKAIYNSHPVLEIDGSQVTIIDYQTPLFAFRSKSEAGEIDLLGIDSTDRLWVIELKVGANSETPVAAYLQALRYAAMLERNRHAITAEVLEKYAREVTWPPAVAVLADRAYWERIIGTAAAGDWRPELRNLADQVGARLYIPCQFVDLGTVEHTVDQGMPILTGPLDVRLAC